MTENKIKPYIPNYKSLPNKFIKYSSEKFIQETIIPGIFRTATIINAHYYNKKGKEIIEVIRVIWDK